MAAVQANHVSAIFLFVGDFNGYHRKWLSSTTTNSHGVSAYDFATSSWLLSTLRKFRSLNSVGDDFDGTGCSKLVYFGKIFRKHQNNLITVCGAVQYLA